MTLLRNFFKEGDTVGKCVFIKELPRQGKYTRRIWCRCICGKEFENSLYKILKGRTCGCRRHDSHNLKHGHNRTGGCSPEYRTWCNMLNRCRNQKVKCYKDYGAKGITVSEDWVSFENFIRDMGIKPSPKHTLERKNVYGNYSKENCIWATDDVQKNNRTDNHFIEYNGERKTLAQWARHLNVRPGLIGNRLKRGWNLEDAFNKPNQINKFKQKTN